MPSTRIFRWDVTSEPRTSFLRLYLWKHPKIKELHTPLASSIPAKTPRPSYPKHLHHLIPEVIDHLYRYPAR